jgi:hypothetical protein
MGLLMVEGEFVVLCDRKMGSETSCDSRQHVLIERDYENFPYAWQLIIGDHDEVVDTLRQPIANYLEVVDGDSAFLLHPLAIDLVDIVAEKLLSEITQAEEEAAKEGQSTENVAP